MWQRAQIINAPREPRALNRFVWVEVDYKNTDTSYPNDAPEFSQPADCLITNLIHENGAPIWAPLQSIRALLKFDETAPLVTWRAFLKEKEHLDA